MLFSFILLSIPIQFPGSQLIKLIVLIPFWIVSFKNIIHVLQYSNKKRIIMVFYKNYFIFIIFILINFIIVIRAYASGVIPLASINYLTLVWITIFSFVFSLILSPQFDLAKMNGAIIYALFFFVASNLSLASLGFRNPNYVFTSDTQNVLARIIGFDLSRDAVFPLSMSAHNFSFLAGAVLVSGIIMLINTKIMKLKLLGLFMIACSLTVIIMNDSRGPLFYSLLAAIIVSWVSKNRNTLKILPLPFLLLPAFSIILLNIIRIVSIYNHALIIFFTRGQSMELLLLNSRILMWSELWEHTANNFDISKILFGYGLYGQVVSGFYFNYVNLFHLYQYGGYYSVHNATLQYFIDAGLIGLIVFVLTIYFALKCVIVHYNANNKYEFICIIGILVYIAFLGVTESFPTVYDRQSIFLFVYIVFLNAVAIQFKVWGEK